MFILDFFGVVRVCVFTGFGCFMFMLVVGGMNVVLCEGMRYYVYNFICGVFGFLGRLVVGYVFVFPPYVGVHNGYGGVVFG